MALRRELSETRETSQKDLESRLLACEGQMSEILSFQKDLKQELSKKTTLSVKDVQRDPKPSPTTNISVKEFEYYKNLVEKQDFSLRELGQEFKIWRKECSRW